ncbi:hypothetical protein [Chondromyces crocatus]|uniref:Uncharacterized protein n=1 Tax=Chondromyces crocatus TaxID=52 RepID=A0A0K1EB67_CHOCO|nr:hypothetical protein [Chondromyces crocatus]AKT38121.1 uncharacterized protein CMC5_022630 [Chondromyces crocatus]
MAKLALTLSTLTAAVALTFSATSQAQPTTPTDHLDDLEALVSVLTPANNTWGSPCAIDWLAGTAVTNGACAFTLSLAHAYPTVTSTVRLQWWGASNPGAPVYYDQIGLEKKFWSITDVLDVLPGDIVATKYAGSGSSTTGTIFVVAEINHELTLPSGNERYRVDIVDSTSSPHGSSDSRYQAVSSSPPVHVQGIGTGEIFLDFDPVSGTYAGHTWSTSTGATYYPNTSGSGGRQLVVGRFDELKP